MTAWKPVWSLSVDGGTYTTVTLSNLTVSSGRTDIYSQPIASYATFEILNTNNANLSIDVNDPVALQVKNSSGTFTPIFGGTVTDISKTVTSSGSTGIVQIYKIMAVGALAKLPKFLTDGVLSKAYDGDQIYSVLSQVLFDTWNEVPAATTWATYEPTVTWANAQNSGLGEIDRPGDYELAARSSSATDVYSLVSALATSGLGYLYEDSAGRIGYADSTHRAQYLSANGYTEISANQAFGPGISAVKRLGDIRNKVTIKYKANAETTASELASIQTYGEQGQIITTSIENLTDAQAQAAFYLLIRAYPNSQFSGITYELTNPELDNADRDALISVFMGQPVDITDLPANFSGGRFQGFVESWTFQAGFNKLSLTLNVSPVAYSLQAFRWNSVPITELWNTLSPTLDWNNATIVA
jgi:hypothetical protein